MVIWSYCWWVNFKVCGCRMQEKKIKVHYPLLVASAYSGYVIWHMGYSSSAALFVASENHTLQDIIGIIPVTETIFSTFNLTTAFLALLLITLINPLMRPQTANSTIEIEKNLFEKKKKNACKQK